MTSIHQPIGIIYHEGGDSYRPFIVINVPLTHNWLSPNISFFQSSGRSSDNLLENVLRKDTWFPTIGLLVGNSPLYTHLRSNDEENINMYTNGYIIKLNALSKIFKVPYTTWKWIGVFQTNLGWLNVPSVAKHSIFHTFVSSKEKYDQMLNIGFLLFKYCVFWWQVQISAQLNGGLWEKYPELRDMVLNYDMNEYDMNPGFIKRKIPLPKIHVDSYINKKDDTESPNINEVNQYLVDNHALYDFSNIPFPAKEVRMKLLKNQPQIIIETEMKMKSITPPRSKINNTKTLAHKATRKSKTKTNNTTRKSTINLRLNKTKTKSKSKSKSK